VTPEQEAERLRALTALRVMDTPREERFDRVVRLAQRLFDVPMVAISLLDADRQWHKGSVGFDVRETPRTEAFCNTTIEQAGPFVVSDAASDEGFRTNPLVTADPGVRFYAGQPLAAPGGQRVGSLCILDSRPRDIAPAELQLLRDLADWVERELALEEELVRASEVQRRLLPREPPVLPGYDVAGRCVPARAVGGDFFDWFPLGDDLQVVLADVMGKGVAAAIIAAGVRSLVRGTSRFATLQEAMNRAAASLDEDLSDTGTFATLFCGRLTPATGALSYVDAGHGLTGVVRASGLLRRLVSDGLPLGVGLGGTLRAHGTRLAPGDTLVCVSDGFLDFFETSGEALVAALRIVQTSSSAAEMVESMCRLGTTEEQADDLTVVVVRRLGDGVAA
jgi:serine phosphatase RsbU (regulator of sigma subunit)